MVAGVIMGRWEAVTPSMSLTITMPCTKYHHHVWRQVSGVTLTAACSLSSMARESTMRVSLKKVGIM